MAPSAPPRGFLLLQPGEARRDELTGDQDLFAAHNLKNIAAHVLGGNLRPADYMAGLPGATEFRKGPGLELAPIAERYPASTRPELRPLAPDVLRRAFTLEPGGAALAEADRGAPVASALGGEAAPPAAAAKPASAAAKPGAKRKRGQQAA